MALAITFLSDYGHADEFAGVCRAVIARIAPGAEVIDLTHGIPRHDVGAGATMLRDALPYCAPGVHLAVVDPGVGGERRAVAVRAGSEGRSLVGPDNGLLVPALERFGGAVEAVEISASPARLEPVSATFHGRDLFAPVAARLALGDSLAELGEPIDPSSLERTDLGAPLVDAGVGLTAEVARIDSFGNAALAAGVADAERAGLAPGARVFVSAATATLDAVYARTFAEVAEGEALLYADSSGSLALAINRGDAAAELGLAPRTQVALTLA